MVGAIGKCGGIPGIEFLVELVLQQLPLVFVFAAIVDAVVQIVVVVVVGAPQDGLIAFFAEPLGGLFESWRGGGLRDENARRVRCRRHFQVGVRRLARRDDGVALRAHAGIFEDNRIDYGRDVTRKVSQ